MYIGPIVVQNFPYFGYHVLTLTNFYSSHLILIKVMSHSRFANPLWHLVDAKNQVVGRLATQIVHILRGKHKPNFAPYYDW